MWFKTIHQLWILWRKDSWTLKKHTDLQSHAFYDDKNNSKNNSNNINILEYNTNGVQVDDIEQVNV